MTLLERDGPVLAMAALYEEFQCSIVAVKYRWTKSISTVWLPNARACGPDPRHRDEKPPQDEAPSNLR